MELCGVGIRGRRRTLDGVFPDHVAANAALPRHAVYYVVHHNVERLSNASFVYAELSHGILGTLFGTAFAYKTSVGVSRLFCGTHGVGSSDRVGFFAVLQRDHVQLYGGRAERIRK